MIYKLDLGGVGPVVEDAKFGCDYVRAIVGANSLLVNHLRVHRGDCNYDDIYLRCIYSSQPSSRLSRLSREANVMWSMKVRNHLVDCRNYIPRLH